MLRQLDAECRVSARRQSDSPQARGLDQRTAGIGAVQVLQVDSGFGEQRRAIAARGVERPADGLDAGPQYRVLTRRGNCPHRRIPPSTLKVLRQIRSLAAKQG